MPEWRGVAVIKCDGSFAKYGTGLEVREQNYTGWEWHPDRDSYPDLLRAQVKISYLEKPEDAHAEVRAQIGKHATEERYFAVDRDRKVMQLIGANALPNKTTTHEKDPFGNNGRQLSGPAGSWQWHDNGPGRNLQYVLNPANTAPRGQLWPPGGYQDRRLEVCGPLTRVQCTYCRCCLDSIYLPAPAHLQPKLQVQHSGCAHCHSQVGRQ